MVINREMNTRNIATRKKKSPERILKGFFSLNRCIRIGSLVSGSFSAGSATCSILQWSRLGRSLSTSGAHPFIVVDCCSPPTHLVRFPLAVFLARLFLFFFFSFFFFLFPFSLHFDGIVEWSFRLICSVPCRHSVRYSVQFQCLCSQFNQ